MAAAERRREEEEEEEEEEAREATCGRLLVLQSTNLVRFALEESCLITITRGPWVVCVCDSSGVRGGGAHNRTELQYYIKMSGFPSPFYRNLPIPPEAPHDGSS